MPESLYRPTDDHACRPNGFGLCQTHATCDHVKQALEELQLELERQTAALRQAHAEVKHEATGSDRAMKVNEEHWARIKMLEEQASKDQANIERKQEEIASLRNACRMNTDTIEGLRKEAAQRDMHEMGRLDVGDKDRIDRWRNEVREALRLFRLGCETTATIKLEGLLGEKP